MQKNAKSSWTKSSTRRKKEITGEEGPGLKKIMSAKRRDV